MMSSLVKPLEECMESNMRLSVLDFSFHDQDHFDASDFKYKALITNFCMSYQRLQDLLLKYNDDKEIKLPCSPDIYSILKKFQYDNWRDNIPERYFIQPLLDRFFLLKADLTKLYSMGIEFWRIPIYQNTQVLEDMKSLIEQEVLSESLLGDRRKREQLNFTFSVLKIIFDGLAREKFLRKGEKVLNLAIPELIALKSLEQINNIFQRKFIEETEGQKYKRHEIAAPEPLIEFALISAINPKEIRTHQSLLPQGHKYSETMTLANKDGTIEIEMDDNSIPELDKYGRFFMWYDYVPIEMHKEICEVSKLLRNINAAVIQDLEDIIITEGMTATHREINQDEGKYSSNL